jgi:hypothetical protein
MIDAVNAVNAVNVIDVDTLRASHAMESKPGWSREREFTRSSQRRNPRVTSPGLYGAAMKRITEKPRRVQSILTAPQTHRRRIVGVLQEAYRMHARDSATRTAVRKFLR